ncbi:hypothetical protein ES703_92925 [subsurface metagenome]
MEEKKKENGCRLTFNDVVEELKKTNLEPVTIEEVRRGSLPESQTGYRIVVYKRTKPSVRIPE